MLMRLTSIAAVVNVRHVSRVGSALKTLTVRAVDVAVSVAKILVVTISFVTEMRPMKIAVGAVSRVKMDCSATQTKTALAVTASVGAARLRLAWTRA